jgi:hypothetical protein
VHVQPSFDLELQCWSLRTYLDVSTALRDSQRFAISGTPVDEVSHTRVLRNAMEAVSPERIAAWKQDLGSPLERGFDLVQEVIEPWCHRAALRLLGMLPQDSDRLLMLARDAFEGGADPFDPVKEHHAIAAGTELARLLPMTLGPLTVQAFVAVSQSLNAFLACSWIALLQNPAQMQLARTIPVSRVIEELLRYAGPSQIQFRYAAESIGPMAQGSRIALRIADANRDPLQFSPDPDKLDLTRNASGHLAFGFGLHACVGASLIRTAASVAIPAFVAENAGATLGQVEWPSHHARAAIHRPVRITLKDTR